MSAGLLAVRSNLCTRVSTLLRDHDARSHLLDKKDLISGHGSQIQKFNFCTNF